MLTTDFEYIATVRMSAFFWDTVYTVEFGNFYSLSRNVLITYDNQLFPSPALQIDAVK